MPKPGAGLYRNIICLKPFVLYRREDIFEVLECGFVCDQNQQLLLYQHFRKIQEKAQQRRAELWEELDVQALLLRC